jgi:hypothetical protein
MMKTVLAVVLLVSPAFADKASREFMKNELAPAVKAAETKVKTACGCALKINLAASIKEDGEMRTAKHIAGSINDEVEKFCSDAESKKSVCQMKTLDIAKAADSKFTFAGGKGTATTDGQSYVSFEMMTRELDKDGKNERAFMKDELQPALKNATTKFKSSCGCDLKINLTASIKGVEDMRQARNIAGSISDGVAGYCTDGESKKAMCQLKSLDLVRGKESSFAFKAGKGTATTDGQSYVSWDMITREIDK